LFRNLPNLFSGLRLLIAPAVSYAILQGRFRLSLLLLACAGVSDALDGYLARRLGANSRIGAYLDPLSDKVLLATVYLSEGFVRIMPSWLVALVFGRDLLILGMVAWGLLFTKIRQFPPSLWGKLSTAVQIAAALLVLADPGGAVRRNWVFAAVAVTTAWSGIHYSWSGIRQLWMGAHIRSWPRDGASAD
jgi:cardiolipin synthase